MNLLAPDLLLGRKILVTGGGTGLGWAIADRLLELGADVAICGRRAPVLDTAAAAMASAHPARRVSSYVCDLRDADAIDAMMTAIWNDDPIDTLVNNAAANFLAQTHLLSWRAADAVMNVTMRGTFNCTLAAGRRWIAAGAPGVVLSILSTSVFNGRAFTVPSAMSKAAILTMTKSLAVEWGRRGIRLVALAPGSFPTLGATARLSPTPGQAVSEKRLRSIPLGRVGDHAELADVAAFMVSDGAAYMTGEMIVLDGGASLSGSGIDEVLDWSDEQWNAYRASVKAT